MFIKKRLGISLISSLMLFISNFAITSLANAESFKIGFISSGVEEALRVQSLIIKELSPFIKDSTGIQFVSYTASPSPQSFLEQLDKASSDPDIKAIITPGFLGSQFLYNHDTFAKPTFLSWIVDPNLFGGEVKNNTRNLHWLSTRNDIETTFASITQVIGKKPVTLVVDAAVANLGESFFTVISENAEESGIAFSVTYLDKSRSALEQLAPETALALVPPMQEGSADVITQIQAGNIPVFTFEGPKTVEEGAMMTDVVDANESLIARSIALDIYGLFQSEEPEPGPRWLEPEHHLTINLASAQRMGVDLSIDALSSATVIGFANRKIDSITLEKAFQWVLQKNPSLAQSRNNIELADESILQAKAALSPQFNASLSHTRYSSSGANVAAQNPDQNSLASVNASQVLYSVVDSTNHKVAKLNKTSQLHLDDANTQNTLVNTLNVFMQVLISESNLAAQQENVRLARSNLSMAEKRVNLGSGIAGDVHNSKASIATANSDLLAARIGALEARRSLMDLSNTAFDENAVFGDVTLDHPSIAASHQLVQPLLETLSGIQKLASWSSEQAVQKSPSLLASSVTIDSNRLQLKAADKGRYSPEIKLNGQAYSYLDSSTGSSGNTLDDVDDVNVSVTFSFPLWSSGRNTSLLRQAKKQLTNSELDYLSSRNAIQVSARNATFSLAQAWQDIKLGKIALSSAQKSLEINQQAYASGALTIDALQNIQNTYISALSADKANVYQYIQALGQWQLQVAAVKYLMAPETMQQWSSDFQAQLY
ncbi:MAG: TolC family protein [Arenicella sp.]